MANAFEEIRQRLDKKEREIMQNTDSYMENNLSEIESYIRLINGRCLNLNSTVEMITKIRYYLLSNMKNELNDLLANKKSELELKTLIQECGFYDDDETDDDSDDEIDDIIDVDSKTPSHDRLASDMK